MKRLTLLIALAVGLWLGCSSDDPVGVEEVRYWDIAWSSPDVVLTDIEMLGPKAGWACGYRFNPSAQAYDGLVYRYDGKSWSVQTFFPAGVGGKFVGLDFTSDADGWVLGYREFAGMAGPVVFHYDGSTWSEVPVGPGERQGMPKMIAAVGPNDVWIADGVNAYHYLGGTWMPSLITSVGEADAWVWPAPDKGWAVDYDTGYCFRYDPALGGWVLEPQPLYNITSFYFNADGSGVYADYVNIPPVTERADIYTREQGDTISYKRIFATGERRLLTACDFFPPNYYFFAGPNSAFEVRGTDASPLNYIPASGLGTVRGISVAAEGNVWGIMGASLEKGPSFIVHMLPAK